jgi:RNA polymerase sigma factor (TIGR02999 family)
MLAGMSEVTRILSAASAGDPRASEELLPLVYEELRKLAAARLADEKPGQTLQATALVHEAYLRLVGNEEPARPWNGRGHFFAAAAEAMRRVLVENARRKGAEKRGGGGQRIPLDDVEDDVEVVAPASPDDLLDLDEALAALERSDRTAAELVKLRYFAGMTLREAAAALTLAPRTADAVWAYARAWLLDRLKSSGPES